MGTDHKVLHGRIQNGVIILNDPIALPEGAAVRVEVVVPAQCTSSGRSLFDVLQPLIGQAHDLPPDAAGNLDHYLCDHANS